MQVGASVRFFAAHELKRREERHCSCPSRSVVRDQKETDRLALGDPSKHQLPYPDFSPSEILRQITDGTVRIHMRMIQRLLALPSKLCDGLRGRPVFLRFETTKINGFARFLLV